MGLYIHIPFCKKKCYYCDFSSYQGQEMWIPEYSECLRQEIRAISNKCKNYNISTIFFGGGTPSYINEQYILNILEECRNSFYFTRGLEISLEANPGTLNHEKLSAYMEAGINRLSIGLQTCDDNLLNIIGRIHNYDEFQNNYIMARNVGFKNINIDLIFGLPGQTLIQWKDTLKEVLSNKPEHISCYSLKIEEGTPFYNKYGLIESRGKRADIGNQNSDVRIELPSEDEEREMYYSTVELLESSGYRHYEISNFCLPDCECKHNLIYWKCMPYIGIGAGAHSYFLNERFCNESEINKYINIIKDGKLPRIEYHKIDKKESMSEFMIMCLRLKVGVEKKEFLARFGFEVEAIYGKQIRKLQKQGLIINSADKVSLTAKGLDFANLAMMEFI